MYQGALFIWGDKAEDELAMIIGYVNVEKSVQNPLGFIKSQIQLAWEAYEREKNRRSLTFNQPKKEQLDGKKLFLIGLKKVVKVMNQKGKKTMLILPKNGKRF